MAIKIDTEAESIFKEEQKRNRKIGLLIAKIVPAVVAAIMIAAAATSVMATKSQMNTRIEEYNAAAGKFEQIKKEAAEAEANAKADSDSDTDNSNKVDRNMYSAYEAGDTIAQLLNKAYKEGDLKLLEDRNTFMKYCGSKIKNYIWYGSTLDPYESPIEWKFLTWYDSENRTYICAWGCYYRSPRDVYYLLYVQYATYNGETNLFSIDLTNTSTRYMTQYGRMLLKNGRIESDGTGGELGEDVGSMADQLAGGNNNSGTGDTSQPTGNDGQTLLPGAPSGSGNTSGGDSGVSDNGSSEAGNDTGDSENSGETSAPAFNPGSDVAPMG